MRFFLFDYNHQLNLFAPTTAVPFLQFGFGKNFFLHHCFYFNNDIFLHKEGKSIMLNKCNSKAVCNILVTGTFEMNFQVGDMLH